MRILKYALPSAMLAASAMRVSGAPIVSDALAPSRVELANRPEWRREHDCHHGHGKDEDQRYHDQDGGKWENGEENHHGKSECGSHGSTTTTIEETGNSKSPATPTTSDYPATSTQAQLCTPFLRAAVNDTESASFLCFGIGSQGQEITGLGIRCGPLNEGEAPQGSYEANIQELPGEGVGRVIPGWFNPLCPQPVGYLNGECVVDTNCLPPPSPTQLCTPTATALWNGADDPSGNKWHSDPGCVMLNPHGVEAHVN